MPTKTISTVNGLTQTVGAANKLIITAGPTGTIVGAPSFLPTISSVKGYCKGNATPGATQYFLQFFNALSTAGLAGLTCLYELQVLSSDGFLFDFSTSPLNVANFANALSSPSSTNPSATATATSLNPANGLILVISSTSTIYTAPVDGCVADIFVEVESDGLTPVQNYQQVGDFVTQISLLNVASDPSSNVLLSFYVINFGNAGGGWIQLFGLSPTSGVTIPLYQWGNPLSVGTSVPVLNAVYKQFGRGLKVEQQDSKLVNHTGIYIGFSSTSGLYTAQSGWTCYALYA